MTGAILNNYKGNSLPDTDAQKAAGRFVFCSSNDLHVQWLTRALYDCQLLHQPLASLDILTEQIAHTRPQLVLLDFSGNCRGTEESCAQEMIALAQTLKIRHPNVHQVAVGSSTYPDGAVAALHAGVHHFIDMQSEAADAREVLRTMITGLPIEGNDPCTVISLLGARAGLGTTTLAVHLADLLQQQDVPLPSRQRVALLDLGVPVADGQLYLNITSTFDLLDAVRNRHRLDATLIQTAIAHNANGIRVISLPRAAENLHALVSTDVLSLLGQLRAYFDLLIVDLGGFPEPDLSMRIANASDQVWLMTDQSVGSLVSLDHLIKTLDSNQVASNKRHLIVNRHDITLGMSAGQIAERFKLNLLATLPECRHRLVGAANTGKLLHELHRGNPYIAAISSLVHHLFKEAGEAPPTGGLRKWLQRWFGNRNRNDAHA